MHIARKAFATTMRVCAICGKAHRRAADGSIEPTYGFAGVLAHNGIKRPDGTRADKAHPSCVKELAKKPERD